MSGVMRVASWDEVPETAAEGALLLQLHGSPDGDAIQGLRRLAELDLPSVAALSGSGGPELLAAALECSIAIARGDLSIDLSDTAKVLSLGLTWLLERHGCAWVLFAPQPLSVSDLLASGLVHSELDPEVVAEQLASVPHTGLIVRSLRSAARSTRTQARAYDAELIALLEAG